ncbi:uncharacterized protein LOC111568737 [Amphiprion ocellaris]|uniref:uncharacterized protein LOC111568737 n=1 Tax=Amphiprion ocellaris TaxID=80972 RepID=UPI000C309294|nr:uncharacterized protein LOC111568737 [Amphiprion ocellaris]
MPWNLHHRPNTTSAPSPCSSVGSSACKLIPAKTKVKAGRRRFSPPSLHVHIHVAVQMWILQQKLYLGLILSHLLGKGGAVQLSCRPGQSATLPCSYRYESGGQVSQLSVQWWSPDGQLLCHYIKHKTFRNCSSGYSISYQPGSIRLTVHRVHDHDFGTHVCSVSKPHKFTDVNIELVRMSESNTSAPVGGVSQSGVSWRIFVLHGLGCLLVFM